MKAMRKSRLGLAVGAALGAAILAPATSFGWSIETDDGSILTNSGGDTLLFPLYTSANAGTADSPAPASTSFSVTNTSSYQTVAAKIRFREQVHSMDVLDFIVVLSPFDKFNFWVDQTNGDARPTMRWTDESCVVGPQLVKDAEGNYAQPFQPPNIPFVLTDAQMSVGHLEVLGMANLESACVNSSGVAPANPDAACSDTTVYRSLAAAAKHNPDTGKPADCSLLVKTLANSGNVVALNTQLRSFSSGADVGNVLVGRYLIDNGVALESGLHIGIEGGGDAISIRNSDLGPPTIPMTSQTATVCYSAQNTNGSTNCSSFYSWDTVEWDHPDLAEMGLQAGTPGDASTLTAGDPDRLANFQAGLSAVNVSGDWSNNPGNDVGVNWVISFPNKYAYLDYVPMNTCGGTSTDLGWCLLYATQTGNGTAGVWTSAPSTDGVIGRQNLCLPTRAVLAWSTEEQESSPTVSVSPGSRTELGLCNELSVLTLASKEQAPTIKPSVIQRNATADDTDAQKAISRQVVEFENLPDVLLGWGAIGLNWANSSIPVPTVGEGDAVTGVIFTTRATSGTADQNGSLTDLQKNINEVTGSTLSCRYDKGRLRAPFFLAVLSRLPAGIYPLLVSTAEVSTDRSPPAGPWGLHPIALRRPAQCTPHLSRTSKGAAIGTSRAPPWPIIPTQSFWRFAATAAIAAIGRSSARPGSAI